MKTLKFLFLTLFVMASVGGMAQSNEIKMKNGTETIDVNTLYYFFDSGGKKIANHPEYWNLWYQHNESYLLHLKKPEGNDSKGIQVKFDYLLINNDHLLIYEGDEESESKLIADLTCNDYSTGYGNTFTVMSHGNMTIRFVSDVQYRDEGWEAQIQLVDYAPKAPVALMEACDNKVHLLPGSMSADGKTYTEIYYTINGNGDPTVNDTKYTAPFSVNVGDVVKTILVEKSADANTGTTLTSAVSTYTFSEIPSAPSIVGYENSIIQRVDGTNIINLKAPKVPTGVNDTYWIRYTTDGSDPANSSSNFTEFKCSYGADTSIEVTQPCWIRAVIRGTTCPDLISDSVHLVINKIYLPSPTFNITGTANANDGEGRGTIELPAAFSTAIIYYTLDGTNPTTATTTNSSGSVPLSGIPAGTTIKALAHINNAAYEDSPIATFVYMPNGADGKPVSGGVFGGIVLLDDREDHTWSYYTEESPIHSLKPADVKITYYGNSPAGRTTMTNASENGDNPTTFSATATGVKVGIATGEGQDQFIYLKTLEAANADGTGNYPYTMIPNPFQVRPTYGTQQITTSTVYISGSAYGSTGVIRVTYVDVNGATQTWERISQTNQTGTITVKDGTTLTVFAQGRTGNRQYSTVTARYTSAQGTQIATATCTSSNYTNGTSDDGTVGTVSNANYRGFYAWRVKSLSSGLTIKSKDGNTTYGVNGIIYADQEIEFITSSQEGNEVEFEALWAQAYVNSNTYVSNSGNYQNAYERNFKVGTSITTYNYPVTFSTINPDGSGTQGTVNQGNYTCSNDVKFENMTISGATNASWNGYAHYFAIGRGVTGTISKIYGIINGSGTNSDNYRLRIESGTYGDIYLARQSGTFTGKVTSILGSDYDRAKSENAKLKVNNNVYLGYGATIGSTGNIGAEAMYCTVKSGNYDFGTYGVDNQFYISAPDGTVYAKRTLIVEGGIFSDIAGGIEASNYVGRIGNNETVYMRFKGGTIKGAVFGAAQYAGSGGHRRFVITGGNFAGWIAGGCNGTKTDGGELYGNTGIYFGGKAQCNSNGSSTTIGSGNATGGNIFGAGSGNTGATGNTATVGRVTNSTIVIADEAVVERNVYGGGNYGYVRDTANAKSDIYVLGGTVKGSVFGGSNMQQGQNVIITMKGGVVENIYGGSNTQGTINDSVTISITGGEVKGNVHGGGYGNSTRVAGSIYLTIGDTESEDNVKIGGDVYGGSAFGKVNTNTTNNNSAEANANKKIILTVNNGEISGNVYGGGLGNSSYAANVGAVTVDINGGKMTNVFGCNNLNGEPKGTVTVNFNDGTALNVYGGGLKANYTNAAGPVVNINGGKVTNNVFGGGSLAEVAKTRVNISGGTVNNNVFAGAEGGDVNQTLVNGDKTVNMREGTVNNVYGGSFKCKDIKTAFVNISGGHVQSHVFGSGYFGKTVGTDANCYVYIGKQAILHAPHSGDNKSAFTEDQMQGVRLYIENNVYAGANYGTYDPSTGFGAATIDGNANIYIDGKGYNQENGRIGNYLVIGGSVYGSGTSCDAGKKDNSVIVRNYGVILDESVMTMTRSFRSVQRVKELVLDNSCVDFVGQGDISSSDPTEEYGMINIHTIRATNASKMSLSKPVEMLHKLGSYYTENEDDVYTSDPDSNATKYKVVTYDKADKNAVVINHGSYLMVRYDRPNETNVYGELEGFFNMQEPADDGINNEGYIFARPKYVAGHGVAAGVNVFAEDGGFVSYVDSKNTFDADGEKVRGTAVQMPYTNRVDNVPSATRTDTTSNTTEYRFWRYDPTETPVSTREIVFVVKSHNGQNDSPSDFFTVDGTVQLPPTLDEENTYHITSMKWGAKGKDCNPAPIAATAVGENGRPTNWMYYNNGFQTTTTPTAADLVEYTNNPNSTFGFVATLGGDLTFNPNKQIFNNESFESYYKLNNAANKLSEVDAAEVQNLPELQFMVTYSNAISQNEMWAEAMIIIEERDKNGEPVQKIYLYIDVTTMTMLGQDVETSVYASTDPSASGKYEAMLTLPSFALDVIDDLEATFTVGDRTNNLDTKYTGLLGTYAEAGHDGTKELALQYYAYENGDGTDGWNSKGNSDPNDPNTFDFKVTNSNTLLGKADGRNSTTIKFDLYYNKSVLGDVSKHPEFQIGQKYLGYLTVRIPISNVKGISSDKQYFDVKVHIYVTGPTKFYYLDGIAGRDGNTGMFPNEAKKTLTSILNADGYSSKDAIFVVKGVTPNANSTLSWDASAFSNQVNVYRYPGSHAKKDGDTNNVVDENNNNEVIFYNGMNAGPIVTVPSGTEFDMINVRLSGGSDLDNDNVLNPKLNIVTENKLKSDNPLISIAAGAKVSIENSSLINNNNTSTTSLVGAIDNKGDLFLDGVTIMGNKVAATEGVTGVYHDGTSMDLGSTAPIVIEDQVYLADKKWMTASDELDAESHFSDIMVYLADEYKTELTHYSGRVIVRYTGEYEPTAPVAPFWKTIDQETGKPYKSTMLQSRKAAAPDYESQKYDLNPYLTGAEFVLANGGDENVLPYIVDAMKDEYHPAASDIIMFRTDANLPVELLYFHATCMGDAVQFEWATASETNNEYFTIERSTDAVHYEEVARIQGAGTTSLRSEYSFMADNTNSGMTYYRLRQTDIDGAVEVFSPVALQCTAEQAVEVDIYPVPARDLVNIVSTGEAISRVEVYNIQGSRLTSQETEGSRLQLNVSGYAAGAYVVKLTTATGKTISRKLIVNK